MLTWFIVGFLSVWISYYSALKSWYLKTGKDYRKYDDGINALKVLLIFSPVYILGGFFSLFLLLGERNICLYFKIPKNGR